MSYAKGLILAPAPTIAVVDDDKCVRDALAELLEVFDFKCEVFEGLEDFLAAHAEGRFDCLITDLKMNGMSGLQLQQKLMTVDPGLPIIFISAQSTSEERSQAFRSGAVTFLNKPIDDDVLHRHIMIALNRPAEP
ncbi:response regulator domain-containing protein (plasmid) [Rhizobium gallicum]|uniref:Response regulator domain-containing protein n=1 Tax=Rhizobium gallicum TaxID=56730 RepID=A0A1L5NY79_9HYPH|nr:response regulator [Rhizobium gallicum]APO72818.1 response regulator domain-containing protein [Rhizobium gallicum]